MRDYIHDKVVTIKKIYKTNDPFELADELGVDGIRFEGENVKYEIDNASTSIV